MILLQSILKSNLLKSTPAEIDFTFLGSTPETEETTFEIASPLVIIFFGILEYNQLFGKKLLIGIEM